MIVPALLNWDKVVITISPLRLIQQNISKVWTTDTLVVNKDTSNDPALWRTVEKHPKYSHYAVSPEQSGVYQGHITRCYGIHFGCTKSYN